MDTAPFKCESEKCGYQILRGQTVYINHESECIYRVVQCPSGDCKRNVSFHQLLTHMSESYHWQSSINNGRLEIEKVPLLRNICHTPHQINFDDKIFVFSGFSGCQEIAQDMVYLWVQLIGKRHFLLKHYTLMKIQYICS